MSEGDDEGKAAVSLRPLDDDALAAFVTEEIANYADEQVRDAGWPREGAAERARLEFGPELARELAEASEQGERLWACAAADGTTVGWLWVRTLPGADPRAELLHQITVAERFRRRGYGRAMLRALERELSREGVAELHLTVLAANEPARRLYAAAGYEQIGTAGPRRHLRKRLAR